MKLAAPAAIVIAVILPFVVSGYHTFQLAQVLAYAIAILGLNLLTGFSGQISLGNGAFYALGAYSAVIAINNLHLPYGVAPVVAAAVCFVLGYLFGKPAARLEGLYLALATFALAVVTPQLLKLDRLEPWTGGRGGVQIDKPVSPFPSVLDDDRWLYMYCLIVAIVMFALAWNVIRGRTGRALIALRDHPIGAGAMGIDIAEYKAVTFGISAMYTGVAGALGALIAGFISPDSFSILVSIQLLVGGVVGGIASIFGTLFGAVFIEFVPNLANQLSDNAPGVVFGVLLILCMRVMPGGLAGLVASARARRAHRGT
ncbi:MAG TPA: branched-chain amino acid ABC transporter permease [Kofleriaceae bacterium]|nr:branched-chain amino acid ABC transporter permease [Kofleriaceae bacterium]